MSQLWPTEMCVGDPSNELVIPCFYTLSWCLQPSTGFKKETRKRREKIQNMNSIKRTNRNTTQVILRCYLNLNLKAFARKQQKMKRCGGLWNRKSALHFMHWEFHMAFSDRFLPQWVSVHLRAGLYLKPCSMSVVRFDPNGSWSPSAAIRKREKRHNTWPKNIILYTWLQQVKRERQG